MNSYEQNNPKLAECFCFEVACFFFLLKKIIIEGKVSSL